MELGEIKSTERLKIEKALKEVHPDSPLATQMRKRYRELGQKEKPHED